MTATNDEKGKCATFNSIALDDRCGSASTVPYSTGETASNAPKDLPIPSSAGLSLSYSSNDSRMEHASLLGERLLSKDTDVDPPRDQQFLLSATTKEESPLPVLPPSYHRASTNTEKSVGLDVAADVASAAQNTLPVDNGAVSSSHNTGSGSTGTGSTGALLGNFVGRVIGHQSEFMDIVACPCCQLSMDPTFPSAHLSLIDPHQTLVASGPRKNVSLTNSRRGLSLLSAEESDNEEDEQLQLDHDMTTGILPEGQSYRLTRMIVEGILNKKGTGKDWLGSRGWKPRWTRLATGRIDGYGDVSVPVPMLCVSWYPNSTSNSTVIVLDSTVVLAVDLPHKDQTQYRFEIRHASSRENASLPVTRTFTAESRKARDTWVYEISQALLSYEKEKALVRKHKNSRSSSWLYRSMSNDAETSKERTNQTIDAARSFDETWMADRSTKTDRPWSSGRRLFNNGTEGMPSPVSPPNTPPPRDTKRRGLSSTKNLSQEKNLSQSTPKIASRCTSA